MTIGLKTPGVHHITLRSSDIDRSRAFYAETLGFPIMLHTPELFLFMAGSTAVGVRAPNSAQPPDGAFSPFRVGLDHIALGCESEEQLERVAEALSEAGVENTGVKLDETLGKRYVAFKDPDGIAWEYYMV
jgi:glyoxylase I family protein